ncbi:MAG: hypothetical protein ACOCX4_07885, partial [Planctomycetota bacterium]
AIAEVPYLAKPPVLDGAAHADWPVAPWLVIRQLRDSTGQVTRSWKARLAFNETHLFLAVQAADDSPMVNSAEDPERLFQFGDGFDLFLGIDPDANPDRTEPAPGDVRLVFALANDRPTAMLYRYRTAAGDAGADPVVFTSPVGRTEVAEVRPLADARMEFVRTGDAWMLEAAVPWEALGGAPGRERFVLRGDVGALVSDPNGVTTVTRFYWANKDNVVMSDLPSEARALPALWGEFRFVVPDLGERMLDDLDEGTGIDDLMDDL